MDAHVVGGHRHPRYAHVLPQLCRHAVHAARKGRVQRQVGVGEPTAGVLRCPVAPVAQRHLHGTVGVAVVGAQSALHSGGINEKLKRRPWLPLRQHFVVLPRAVVHVAHPRLDVARARLHGHHAAVQEAQHVAQRVHRAHRARHGAAVGEQPHGVGAVEVIAQAVGLVREAGVEYLVCLGALNDGVGEMRQNASAVAAPGLCCAPLAVERDLRRPHVGEHGLLGVVLHAAVERRIDFQPVNVRVELGTMVHKVARYSLAEIVGRALIHVSSLKVELQRLRLQRLGLSLGEVAAACHVVEHDVAAH